jgi:dephospho-CoA kinase
VPILGITGGIATGKTTFTNALRQRIDAEVFDADACAKELLATDGRVQRAVRMRFGESAFTPQGTPDRERLRAIVFGDAGERRALEEILHPAIRERWIGLAEKLRASNEKGWLFVDIPLLFETKAESFFDRTVVVACSPATQRDRLTSVRKLPPALADQMIASQLLMQFKIERAGHVVWNESTTAVLDSQAGLLADYLKRRYE